MTKLEVGQDHIKTKGRHFQTNQGKTKQGILSTSVGDPSKSLIKAGIKIRECIRTPEEVTMTNKGSMIQEASTLTHVKDPRCILVRDIRTDRDRARESFLRGTSIQIQGSFQSNIATGVPLPQASKDILVIPTLTRR